jgi:hypothetical protein
LPGQFCNSRADAHQLEADALLWFLREPWVNEKGRDFLTKPITQFQGKFPP